MRRPLLTLVFAGLVAAGGAGLVACAPAGAPCGGLVLEDDARVAPTPSQGWSMSDHGWVEAAAEGDWEAMYANDLVTALRTQVDPQFLPAILAAASGYTVAGKEETQLADGNTASLWKIVSDASVTYAEGVAPTDVAVYTETLGPIVKVFTTSGAASSTRYFSNWGGSFDRSEIEDLVAGG